MFRSLGPQPCLNFEKIFPCFQDPGLSQIHKVIKPNQMSSFHYIFRIYLMATNGFRIINTSKDVFKLVNT